MAKIRNKSGIVHKMVIMTAVSILVVTAVFLIMYLDYDKKRSEEMNNSRYGDVIVALNEIDNLLHNNEVTGEETATDNSASDNVVGDNSVSEIDEKIQSLIATLQIKKDSEEKYNGKYLVVFYIAAVGVCLGIFSLVYVLVLKPFKKLEEFAAEIATGNLDKELKYNRVHVFGEFTWAFDHMRHEIKKARACEQEAIENNKTVIATLSHDIKTPIASIRAYGEALLGNMDSTPERRSRYLDVIIKKCDEVTRITNDMFIHSLHNLDKLVIKNEDVKIHEVISDTVHSMEGDKGDINVSEIEEAVIPNCDAGRVAQVIENIINNARKYAQGEIFVRTEITDEEYILSIKDSGMGIPPEDMPFIFEKFYRGKNKGEQAGAGLGLFIVKYIMEQLGGRVELRNEEDGLLVKLNFKK
ncbi:MAG: HAMP domain-containing histidine kinase [Lachnospiraceae bacterium]|nr:HAMP domain-containing histidine kinase [Lachnospiraceae bacterium]